MTLRISLRDGEKMIVNGAVLRSVGRTDMIVENHAAIMRGREVMAPDEATTPARRLYFACMMAYIHSDGLEEHRLRIIDLLRDLVGAFESAESADACVSFAHHVAMSDFYRALSDCRRLMDCEGAVLSRAPQAA